jgi:hypothetical protein
MAIPSQITDGSFSTAVQHGPATWSLPFQDRGDTQSFEYRAVFRQDQSTYTPLRNSYNPFTGYEYLSSIVTARGVAYLVAEGDTRSIGNGILEFERTYASLPRTRKEGTSITYPLQFLATPASTDVDIPPDKPSVEELPLTLNATTTYEYFLTVPDVLYAPKVFVVFGSVWYFGDFSAAAIDPGSEILAENSETTIYKPGMWQRKSIRIVLQPIDGFPP